MRWRTDSSVHSVPSQEQGKPPPDVPASPEFVWSAEKRQWFLATDSAVAPSASTAGELELLDPSQLASTESCADLTRHTGSPALNRSAMPTGDGPVPLPVYGSAQEAQELGAARTALGSAGLDGPDQTAKPPQPGDDDLRPFDRAPAAEMQVVTGPRSSAQEEANRSQLALDPATPTDAPLAAEEHQQALLEPPQVMSSSGQPAVASALAAAQLAQRGAIASALPHGGTLRAADVHSLHDGQPPKAASDLSFWDTNSRSAGEITAGRWMST